MRSITKKDLPYLQEVINSNELFPGEMLEEMTENFFSDSSSQEIWITQELDGYPIAVAYCAPERMTEGTYNLFLIAVHQNHQGKGLGTKIMMHIEQQLKAIGARILIVETSSLAVFELTRKFYTQLGYQQEAVIREFYQKGEHKIVFWKNLALVQ